MEKPFSLQPHLSLSRPNKLCMHNNHIINVIIIIVIVIVIEVMQRWSLKLWKSFHVLKCEASICRRPSSQYNLKFTLILFMILSLYEQYSHTYTHTHTTGGRVKCCAVSHFVTHEYILSIHCSLLTLYANMSLSEKSKILCFFFSLIKFVYFLLLPPLSFIILLHHTFFPHLKRIFFPHSFHSSLSHACSHRLVYNGLILDWVCRCMRGEAGEKIFKAWMKYFYDLTRFSLGNFERTFFLRIEIVYRQFIFKRSFNGVFSKGQ
jgi:hypothetical protein